MKVQTWLITGATGLVGTALQQALRKAGHRVRTLSRSPKRTFSSDSYAWDPTAGTPDRRALDNVDVVVHLAGASVGQRWTPKHKRAILESRVQGTTLLRDELQQCGFAGTWIQASAVGYYGNTPTPCDEKSSKGEGFLADVVEAWEQASVPSQSQAWRLLHLRLGLVLSGKGGTLDRLWPIYRLGLGAPLGSGNQAMSWIHLEDVVRMMLWLAQSRKPRAVSMPPPLPRLPTGSFPNPLHGPWTGPTGLRPFQPGLFVLRWARWPPFFSKAKTRFHNACLTLASPGATPTFSRPCNPAHLLAKRRALSRA